MERLLTCANELLERLMDIAGMNNSIDELIQMESDFIEKLKQYQTSIVEEESFSNALKEAMSSKFVEIESGAKKVVAALLDAKALTTGGDTVGKKGGKKTRKPKIATDVWSLLK